MGRLRKGLKITGIVLGAVVLLLSAVVLCLTLWLTPPRLTALINREASRYFNADIRVSNARFTFWSTFPRFCIQTDSILVVSRTLRDVPVARRRMLPADCDTLARASSLRGGINIYAIIGNRFLLHDIEIGGLDLNLVALNDSLANYNILPPSATELEEMPYFSANAIRLLQPGTLDYYSAPNRTRAHVALQDASLVRVRDLHDTYEMSLPGTISASADGLRLLHNFPVSLSGLITLHFKPFGLRLSSYNIALGNTRGVVNMDMQIGHELRINNLDYRISAFNPLQLMRYLPSGIVPSLERLHADLSLYASARLTSPWNLTSEALPSLEVDFRIPQGYIEYTLTSGSLFRMQHSEVTAAFRFNGQSPDNSYVDVAPFTLSTPGTCGRISARVTSLTRSPRLSFTLSGTSDLRRTFSPLLLTSGMSIAGRAVCDTRFAFSIQDYSLKSLTRGLRSIRAGGSIDVAGFRFSAPAQELTAAVPSTHIRFGTSASLLADSELSDDLADARVTIPSASLAMPGHGHLWLSGISLHGLAADAGILNLTSIRNEFPASMLFGIDSIRMELPEDSLSLRAGELQVLLRSPEKLTAGLAAADVSLASGNLHFHHPAIIFHLNDVNTRLRVSNVKTVGKGLPLPPPSNGPEDARTLRFAAHTPLFISGVASQSCNSAPCSTSPLRSILSADFAGHVTAGSGTIETPYFPVDNRVRALDIAFCPDSISVRRLSLKSQATGLVMRGRVGNLKQFLSSPRPATLLLDLDAALDTVNINQLSRAYVRGVKLTTGRDATKSAGHPEAAPDDTVALLLPRNLKADIRLSADETVYTNLRLYDLGTRIRLDGGDAFIDTLNISSDFGHGALKLQYLTSDMQRMGIRADVAVTDVNVVNFFRNFHTLLLMMPEMKNLSGTVGLAGRVDVPLFPSMYLNLPGLRGAVRFNGDGLTLHQNHFIRHITRMMGIRSAEDIHISDVTVKADIHDNLLQLQPFDFEVSRYKLNMVGLNNFDGRLYYHIAVLKSPVPFPFAINITNYFHDPHLSFGGPVFKVDRGEMVTADIMERNRINLVREARYYLKEFVTKAAEYPDSVGN